MTGKFAEFEISSKFIGDKGAVWDSRNENYHKVTVKSLKTKKRTSFDFWASIAHPEIDSEKDLLEAFECFISDAVAGNQSFEQFCNEFGYDTDSRKAEKTWRACQNSLVKFLNMSGYSVDEIYDLWNELSEAVG